MEYQRPRLRGLAAVAGACSTGSAAEGVQWNWCAPGAENTEGCYLGAAASGGSPDLCDFGTGAGTTHCCQPMGNQNTAQYGKCITGGTVATSGCSTGNGYKS